MDFLLKDFTIDEVFRTEYEPGFPIKGGMTCAAIQLENKPHTYLKNEYGSVMLYRHAAQAARDAKIIAQRKKIDLRVVFIDLVNKQNGPHVTFPCVLGSQEYCELEKHCPK